jgi:hypothetical protein
LVLAVKSKLYIKITSYATFRYPPYPFLIKPNKMNT